MKFLLILGSILVAGAGLFFIFGTSKNLIIEPKENPQGDLNLTLLRVPEPPLPTSTPPSPPTAVDITNQPPLQDPPRVVKGIYATSWSAGSENKIKYLLDLIDKTELNAIVIDIKDYSGYVAYRTGIPEVRAAGAEDQIRIAKPNALLKRLHDKNIYVIGRISVFQDPILAKAHPEWALVSSSTGKLWEDRKGLLWMDPAAEPVWDYNLKIARDALTRGFDEINFDYIRFASDGDLKNIKYPVWDEKSLKSTVIKNFFSYLRKNLPQAKISADLFGLATVNQEGLGIGQIIEDAYEYFDYVSPMVYPSHYAPGFNNYKNPAEHPYEVIRYSLDEALRRLENYSSSTNLEVGLKSKLRPWLQDFNLGATYGPEMVRREIQAVEDSLNSASSSNAFAGWLLWDPANVYTAAALQNQ
ncbi:MAG: hypothetical protein HYT13_01545 [Candidatus Liptonbacteria bacterium]|nr:hypothetical protein [Candidatus Liptonbacteria bacterium]